MLSDTQKKSKMQKNHTTRVTEMNMDGCVDLYVKIQMEKKKDFNLKSELFNKNHFQSSSCLAEHISHEVFTALRGQNLMLQALIMKINTT